MKQFEIRARVYFVSSEGEVYDIDGIEQSLRLHRGYVYFKRRTVHRLVAKAYCEEWFDECEVHHVDRNKFNNNASNLVCISKLEHKKIHANDMEMALKEEPRKPKRKKRKSKQCFNRKFVINK
jgi:hypothetical protein